MTKNYCDQCQKEIIDLPFHPNYEICLQMESTISLTIHKETKIFCDVGCMIKWLKIRGNLD
jgi:hypothetical protein